MIHPPLRERFLQRIDVTEGCWLWTGSRGNHGYGEIIDNGKKLTTHRVAWMLAHGPIPPKGVICHTCDTRLCVRPSHLFLGTQADNLADMRSKGRQSDWSTRPLAGEKHPRARLTAADVGAIRALAQSGLTQRAIAARYGISQSHVGRIVRGSSWMTADERKDMRGRLRRRVA